MPINRNQLTPLTKGGARTVNAGKGSRQAPLTNRRAVTAPMRNQVAQSGALGPAPTMNNYAKATPAPGPAGPVAPPGLGTGVFPGVSG
jgi:hypothetical protein